jgi:hypothetical protein
MSIFGPKRDEIIGLSRKFYSEELHKFYSPPDIIRMINSRRGELLGHIARMEKQLCGVFDSKF